jgi:hypothetical protein
MTKLTKKPALRLRVIPAPAVSDGNMKMSAKL